MHLMSALLERGRCDMVSASCAFVVAWLVGGLGGAQLFAQGRAADSTRF